MQIPEVHYTKVDGLSIAWQQYGTGPDVLVIPGLVSNVELVWEHEFYRRVNELMAKHLRLTTFDKRGMGLSERTQENQTIDQRMADVLAVMDAAGIERAHLLGISEDITDRKLAEQALNKKMDELERFHNLTVGRELKMIELKKEVNALLKQAGKPEEYMIIDEKHK